MSTRTTWLPLDGNKKNIRSFKKYTSSLNNRWMLCCYEILTMLLSSSAASTLPTLPRRSPLCISIGSVATSSTDNPFHVVFLSIEIQFESWTVCATQTVLIWILLTLLWNYLLDYIQNNWVPSFQFEYNRTTKTVPKLNQWSMVYFIYTLTGWAPS